MILYISEMSASKINKNWKGKDCSCLDAGMSKKLLKVLAEHLASRAVWEWGRRLALETRGHTAKVVLQGKGDTALEGVVNSVGEGIKFSEISGHHCTTAFVFWWLNHLGCRGGDSTGCSVPGLLSGLCLDGRVRLDLGHLQLQKFLLLCLGSSCSAVDPLLLGHCFHVPVLEFFGFFFLSWGLVWALDVDDAWSRCLMGLLWRAWLSCLAQYTDPAPQGQANTMWILFFSLFFPGLSCGPVGTGFGAVTDEQWAFRDPSDLSFVLVVHLIKNTFKSPVFLQSRSRSKLLCLLAQICFLACMLLLLLPLESAGSRSSTGCPLGLQQPAVSKGLWEQ